jgi:hypothetical protein
MNLFCTVRQSGANGIPANLGTGASIAVTELLTLADSDVHTQASATVVNATAGLVCVSYDPAANGDAGGYVTVTLGTGASAGCVAGDLILPVSFAVGRSNMVGIGGTLFTGNTAQEAAAFELSFNQPSGQYPLTQIPPLSFGTVGLVNDFTTFMLTVLGGNAQPHVGQQIQVWISNGDIMQGVLSSVSNTGYWLVTWDSLAVGTPQSGDLWVLPSFSTQGQIQDDAAAAIAAAKVLCGTNSTPVPNDATTGAVAATDVGGAQAGTGALGTYGAAKASDVTTSQGVITTAISAIPLAVWNVLTSTLTLAGSIGKYLLGIGDPIINVLPGYVSVQNNTVTTALPTAWQNSAYSVTFPVLDGSGNPIDLSGVALKADFWLPNASDVVSFSAATSGDSEGTITIGGTNHNMVTMTLNMTGTTASGTFTGLLRNTADTIPPYTSMSLTVNPAPAI